MVTGVAISPDIITVFEEMKLRKKYKFVIFKMSPDDREIVIDKMEEGGTYEEFLKEFPNNECRYGLFDFVYNTDEGGARQRLCFFLWTPAGAPLRARMLYASSKSPLRDSLSGGIYADIQATDASETNYDEVIRRLENKR